VQKALTGRWLLNRQPREKKFSPAVAQPLGEFYHGDRHLSRLLVVKDTNHHLLMRQSLHTMQEKQGELMHEVLKLYE
jgi:hypothetical protein